MASAERSQQPIFVGGTGRSGTTVMGRLIQSHRDYCKPASENKLIVERYGLRTLVDELSDGADYRSNDHTIKNFIQFAARLRSPAFKDPGAQRLYRAANYLSAKIARRGLPVATVARLVPFLDYSRFSLGWFFRFDHYDACIDWLLDRLVADTDPDGVVDFDGRVAPVYIPVTLERSALIGICREFLDRLYAPHIESSGAQGWTDDTPFSVLYQDFLFELYPDARLIHMVRHPMDVFTSHMEQPWASSDPERTLLRLERLYARMIAQEQAVPDPRVLTLRLEDVSEDWPSHKRSVLDFCRLPEDGLDGSVEFRTSGFGKWRTALPDAVKRAALQRLSFAITHYDYPSD